jgi:hypothetical protein
MTNTPLILQVQVARQSMKSLSPSNAGFPSMISLLLLLVLQSHFFHFASSAFVTKAWQSLGESYTFPETDYPDIQAKENVGITFSGGGDRSYVATMGYLGAFHELGYMDRIKYIAGSSGGSWATVVYSYFQHDDISDDVMLGKIVFPEEIEYSELPFMEEGCVRAYVNSTYILTGPFFSDWMDAVQVSKLLLSSPLFSSLFFSLLLSSSLFFSLPSFII